MGPSLTREKTEKNEIACVSEISLGLMHAKEIEAIKVPAHTFQALLSHLYNSVICPCLAGKMKQIKSAHGF